MLLPEGVDGLQPIDAVTREPPSKSAVRTLDPEEIKLLVKQGEQFAEAGDLAGARILFQRAAEAGDATAAATAMEDHIGLVSDVAMLHD